MYYLLRALYISWYCLFSALSIRYGKYCGIGHSRCPGENPCDDLDACCMVHDNCVEANGTISFKNANTLLFLIILRYANQKVHYLPFAICFPFFWAGMTNVSCHKKFKQCLNRLSKSIKESKSKKVGFSKQCPYSLVIPTMNQGMDIGIMFSQLGNDLRTELWVLLRIYSWPKRSHHIGTW